MTTMGRYYCLAQINQALPAGTSVRFPAAPLHFGEWASEVTYVIGVHAVLGAPTDWSVTARPLFRANQIGGTYKGGFPWRSGLWFPLDDASVKTCITQGEGFNGPGVTPLAAGNLGGFATVASQASRPDLQKGSAYLTPETAAVVTRTFRNFGSDVGLDLNINATGGTTPSIAVSVNIFGK